MVDDNDTKNNNLFFTTICNFFECNLQGLTKGS